MDDDILLSATINQSTSMEATIAQPSLNVVISQPAYVDVAVVSGPPGPPGPAGSGVLALTGQYPIFYDAGSGVVGIVSGYYVTFPDLNAASGALVAQITAASAGVSALNGLSGFVSIAAVKPLFISSQGQTLYISGSGLATSGDINGLGASMSALSGYTNTLVAATGQAAWTAAQNNATNLSGNLGATGSYLYNLITGQSAGAAGVSSLNTRTGAVLITGAGNVTVSVAGQTITVSGLNSGEVSQAQLNSLSGYVDSQDYATGRSAILYASGASGALQGAISVLNANPSGFITTGQTGQFYPVSNPQAYATSGNLQATGSSLYGLLTGASGQSVADYATKAQLTTTGQTLDNKINALSGFVGGVSGGLEARLFQTGAAAIAYANTVGTNLSGNLAATGAALIARDTAISGGLEARIFQTGAAAITYINSVGSNLSGNLQLTGSNLQTQINAITAGTGAIVANVVYTTGTQFISGTKYFIGTTYIDNLVVTGTQTIVNTQDVYVGDNWLVLNATGGARDSALFIATGLTGVSATGAVMGWDVPTNTWRFGLASQQTDLLTLPRVASGEAVDDANARITSLSGFTVAMSGGLEVRIAQTGAAMVAYANGIGSNLSGNLTLTGQTLLNQINALSGFVGNVSGGLEARIALTGSQAWNAANNNGINLSGNMAATGAALIARDNAISGVLDLRIVGTGVAAISYSNSIGTNLSGNLTQSGVQLQSLIYGGDTNLSGNLTTTGATLNNRISSLSGWAAPAYQANITVSANYSVVGTEPRIYCNNTSPITLSFPSAATVSGFLGKVKLINTGSVTLTGTAGQLFDASPAYVIIGQYAAREVHSNGVNWYMW